MSSSVEKIKEKLSIVDVISSYLKLDKAGANFKAICPFHNEKSPSFFVSPSRNSYYCFGCGQKGDIFTFVEQFEGLDFKGALASLALRAGVDLEPYRKDADTKERSEKERLFELMELAARFYVAEFEKNAEAQEYVKSRGLTDASKKDFRIGFAPKDWRTLTSAMRAAGFSDEEIVKAGLAKHPDENPSGEIYDRFRDRVMFPIADTGGRIIAFSGRMLHDDGSGVQGKYINSPETPIFKKGSTLYGLDKAKFEIRKRDQAILVEGQMDLVLSHQAGFTNTVASSGTALGDTLLADAERGLLSGLGAVRALTNNLVVAYDGDKAGTRAAGRVESIGLSLGMNVKVAKLPKGLDPADTIREKGSADWKKIIDGAEHIVLFYLSVLDDHELSEHTRMRAVRDKILPYVAVMPSAVERAHFIRQIHLRTGIAEEAITEDVARLMATNVKAPSIKTESVVPEKIAQRSTRIEDRLLGIIFSQEEKSETGIDVSAAKRQLEDVIGSERFNTLYTMPPEKKNERIFEIELLYDDQAKLASEMAELLLNLEEETLGASLQNILSQMSGFERESDADQVQLLLMQSQLITRRLNEIKSSRFLTT